jgi:hypothetical protein
MDIVAGNFRPSRSIYCTFPPDCGDRGLLKNEQFHFQTFKLDDEPALFSTPATSSSVVPLVVPQRETLLFMKDGLHLSPPLGHHHHHHHTPESVLTALEGG